METRSKTRADNTDSQGEALPCDAAPSPDGMSPSDGSSLRDGMLFLFGMSFYWSLFALYPFASGLFADAPLMESRWRFSLITFACYGAVSLVLPRIRRAGAPKWWHGARLALVVILAAVSYLVCLLAGRFVAAPPLPAFALASVLLGSVLTWGWAGFSRRFDIALLASLLAGSLLLSLLFGVTYAYAADALGYAGGDSNPPLLLVSAAFLVLASKAPTTRTCAGSEKHMTEDSASPISADPISAGSGSTTGHHNGSAYLVSAVILFCYLLGSGVLRVFYSLMSENYWISNQLLHCVMGLLTYFALLVFLLARAKEGGDPVPWVFLTVAYIVVLYAIALLYPYRPDICEEIILPTRPLAYLLLWASLVLFARARGVSVPGIATMVLLPACSLIDLACNAVFYLGIPDSGIGLSVQMIVLGTALAVTFGLVAWLVSAIRNERLIGNVFVYTSFGESGVAGPEGQAEIELHEPAEKPVQAEGPMPPGDGELLDIARESSLSKRETEVMELIYAGNTQKKIADVLCLSLNSVQTYIKSLYRKLGVHSRQQLIDLVNARQDE